MIIYYIDGEKFLTEDNSVIPLLEISSPNERTPAFENLESGFKFWCLNGGIHHRLTGPAFIWDDGRVRFYLNDKRYDNVNDWLKVHPNQDNAFQVEMILKYT
jgi:hypothetical protein